MPTRFIFIGLLLSYFFLMSTKCGAQATKIDTIVVNLSSKPNESADGIKSPTPILDLEAMRKQAKEDSIRIAKISAEKADIEKKREELKEKQKQEKLSQQTSQQEEQVQRTKEVVVDQRLNTDVIVEKAGEKTVDQMAKVSDQKTDNQSVSAEIYEKQRTELPAGVVQKDNVYGTVRLSFDENAASFLLSIPTETKMHFHKDHSEHIMLIEGEGMVLMGYKTIKLKKDELVFITKGTPHKIINSGRTNLKVLSIQSPFYDGSDITILE